MKLLAATTFNEQLPMLLRDAIEHEAVMVVRLQRRTTGGTSLASHSSRSTQTWTDANTPSNQSQTFPPTQSPSQQQYNQPQQKAQTASYSSAQPMMEMQPE